jgi:hypothetical protein
MNQKPRGGQKKILWDDFFFLIFRFQKVVRRSEPAELVPVRLPENPSEAEAGDTIVK